MNFEIFTLKVLVSLKELLKDIKQARNQRFHFYVLVDEFRINLNDLPQYHRANMLKVRWW